VGGSRGAAVQLLWFLWVVIRALLSSCYDVLGGCQGVTK